MTLKQICVYCGSSVGLNSEYARAAENLGRELVQRNFGLVYGGGSVGLMGKLSKEVHERGGSVLGIIPKKLLPKEISGETSGELIVTEDMHERKKYMSTLADAFIALPGGFGTLEELLEILTWHQLGLHAKPVGILNVSGFFDSFLRFLDDAVAAGFISETARQIPVVGTTPTELIEKLLAKVDC